MRNAIDQSEAQRLYLDLGALASNSPDLLDPSCAKASRWLGRVHAILLETYGPGNLDVVQFSSAVDSISPVSMAGSKGFRPLEARTKITNIINRTLGFLERASPPSISGAFIGAGQEFSALISIGKILREASYKALFVDPYAAMIILSDYAVILSEGVDVQILGGATQIKSDLAPAIARWKSQHGATRPLEVRVAQKGSLHDRALFIDDKNAWSVGTSFNGLGRNAPSLLQKVGDEIFPEKLSAYRNIWNSAEILA